jgi:hypothetical protein
LATTPHIYIQSKMSYNPFDEDADVVYYVQFGAAMTPKDRREARHAAIIWCINQGLQTLAIQEKLGVSSGLISSIRTANGLKSNRTAEDYKRMAKRNGFRRSENAGYTPMTLERATLLRADAVTMTGEALATKYNISKGFVSQIKNNHVWTS